MTFWPTVPRPSKSAASRASASVERLIPKSAIGLFRARNGLKDEIDRSAEVHSLDGGRHMTEAAGLSGNVEALPDLVEKGDDTHVVLDAVGRRVHANHRVADAEQEAVEQARGDAAQIVGRMVRLKPGGKSAGKSDRVAECGDHAAFGADNDEVLHAHDFRYCGGHLRGQAGRQRGEAVGCRARLEQPLAKLADRQMGYRRKGRRVVTVVDQPGNFVLFIRDKIDLQEGLERKVRERHLGRHAFNRALRRDAG